MVLGNVFILISFIVGGIGILFLTLYILYRLVFSNKNISIFDADIPTFDRVNQSVRNITMLYSEKVRGSVRISNANFYVDEEIDRLRKEAFSKELP